MATAASAVAGDLSLWPIYDRRAIPMPGMGTGSCMLRRSRRSASPSRFIMCCVERARGRAAQEVTYEPGRRRTSLVFFCMKYGAGWKLCWKWISEIARD